MKNSEQAIADMRNDCDLDSSPFTVNVAAQMSSTTITPTVSSD